MLVLHLQEAPMASVEVDAVGFQHLSRHLSTDDENTEFQDSAILRDTFIIYGSIFVAALLIFCYVRLRNPKVYNLRNWVDGLKTHLAEDQYRYFSWLWKLYAIPEEEILNECGVDATCYLRLVWMGFKLSCVAVFNSVYLLPAYYTAEESSETENIDDGVVMTTISHVPSGSNRMFATLFASYIFFGYLMWLIVREFKWYIAIRHKHLSRPLAQHFAVFVRNIPPQYRDNQHLADFFRACFSSEEVLEARLALKITHLEKTVANREETLAKLEHAHAVYQTTGERPEHKEKTGKRHCCGEKVKVDSIDAYTQQLEEQNKDIGIQINSLQAIVAGNSTPTSQNDAEADVGNGADAPEVVSGDESHVADLQPSANAEPKKDDGEAKGLLRRNMDLVVGHEGQTYSSGFVVFKTLLSRNAALQMLHHPAPFQMEILEAPAPADVFWGNVGRTHKDLQVGLLGSLALTTALCLVWTIPMSFFASLSNADAVRQDIEWLDDLFNKYPGLVPFVEQLAPFLVVIFNALLPLILKYFTLLEGPISTGVVESSRFMKLAIFQIVQTFFVSTISGSIFSAISDIIDDPSELVDLLAVSLPAQSTYFMQIVLITTIIGSSVELLRIVPLITSSLRRCVGPNLTEKERSKAAFGLRPLSDPPFFVHATYTSQLVLFYMILFVYAVLSPITPIITGVCFLYMGAAYRHQFVYICPKYPDTGGKLWSGFLQIILFCALIAQIIIIGVLGLKKGVKQVPFFIPLICITALYVAYIRQMHFRTAAYLPTHECFEADLHRDPGFNFSLVEGAYIQPALHVETEVAPDTSLEETPAFKDATSKSDVVIGISEKDAVDPKGGPAQETESAMLHKSDEGIENV